MRYNSIGYPNEREPRKSDIVEQPGYSGKNYYSVVYAGQMATIHCADETAALFYAARHWQVPFKRAEYHQTAKVNKLGYQPGALL